MEQFASVPSRSSSQVQRDTRVSRWARAAWSSSPACHRAAQVRCSEIRGFRGGRELHGAVRQRAIAQLKSGAARYEGFAAGESFMEYLDRMAQPSTWGDNLS